MPNLENALFLSLSSLHPTGQIYKSFTLNETKLWFWNRISSALLIILYALRLSLEARLLKYETCNILLLERNSEILNEVVCPHLPYICTFVAGLQVVGMIPWVLNKLVSLFLVKVMYENSIVWERRVSLTRLGHQLSSSSELMVYRLYSIVKF